MIQRFIDNPGYGKLGEAVVGPAGEAPSAEPAIAQAACVRERGRLGYRFAKRAFDIVFSLGVVIVGFIPGLVLSAIIVAESKGSPIYTQERVGRGGKPLRILKFRSMVSDADDVEKHFTPEQLEQWKSERKVDDDPRITRVGRFIRSTSLDEMPQFLNVLAGQMSVVGPRPITEDELAHFGSSRDLFLSVPGGITGWWQVNARNGASFEDGARQDMELFYARNASLLLDAKVVLGTFGAIVRRTGK